MRSKRTELLERWAEERIEAARRETTERRRATSGDIWSGRTCSASRWPSRMCARTSRCSDTASGVEIGREIIGQLVRLVVAAPGTWTGRYPVGNTGGANVSALKPMPIPDDLQAVLNGPVIAPAISRTA